jgi:hypothetical protein
MDNLNSLKDVTEKVNQVREDFKNERVRRGAAFEEIQRFDGFKFIKEFYETKLRMFANASVIGGFKNMEEFSLERGKVLGLQELFSEIEASVKTLEDERAREQRTTAN